MSEMKVTDVTYTRRFNLGNYEHEEMTVSAIVEDGGHPVEVIKVLKALVMASHATATAPVSTPVEYPAIETPEVTEEAVEEKPAPKKRGPKKKETVVVEEPAQEEDEEEELEDALEEVPEVSAEEEEDPFAEEEPAPAPKKKKSANTPYDKENRLHKKLVAEFLTEEIPDWKTKVAQVQKVSAKLNGVDLLDSKGQVLPEFRQDFVKNMALKLK